VKHDDYRRWEEPSQGHLGHVRGIRGIWETRGPLGPAGGLGRSAERRWTTTTLGGDSTHQHDP
jgi:hypothetical protein